ncbi:MAG TPA: hypothetical protein VGG68_00990 [Caulobacteraceae bacterium]|jgi:hypothetical protein
MIYDEKPLLETIIPAQPGTFLMHSWVKDGVFDSLRIPVIAWAFDCFLRPSPITLDGVNDGISEGYTSNLVILFPSGHIIGPVDQHWSCEADWAKERKVEIEEEGVLAAVEAAAATAVGRPPARTAAEAAAAYRAAAEAARKESDE